MTASSLRLIAWPYHAGLADVSMGLGTSVLACWQVRCSATSRPDRH
jgi:hypothetical protein